MATAYTSLLGLALPVQGELQGTWGDTVNNSITSLLDTAVAGTTTISADADVTLTTTTGASNQARQAIILWTANGTVTRNITAPAQSKIYTVINKTAGTQSIVLRGVGPTTGVTIPAGASGTFAWNGTDFVDVSNYVNGNKIINGNLTVNGNTTLGDASGDSVTINAGTTTFVQGTANGVAYLNGSKVLTTGSALTFDGTTLKTNSGNNALHLIGDANGPYVSFYNSASRIGYIRVTDGGAFLLNPETAGSNIQFRVADNEQMRLTSTGLGIGTSSPDSKLHVFTGSGSNTASLRIGYSGTSANYYDANTHYFRNGAQTDTMTLTSTGLGIGTSSPGAKLDVSGDIIGRATTMRFKDSGNTTQYGAIYADATTFNINAGVNNLLLYSAGTERARITSTGNFAIGDTGASSKLFVRSDSSDTVFTDQANVASGSGIIIQNESSTTGSWAALTAVSRNNSSVLQYASMMSLASGSGYAPNIVFAVSDSATTSAERMRISSTGLVGIGTNNPQTALQVNAGAPTIRLEETTTGGSKRLEMGVTSAGVAFIGANQSAQDLVFQTVGSERMRVGPTGNVGIGTNSPARPFEVAATASIDTTGSTGKWTASFRDLTATAAAGVGGSLLLQGLKSTAGSVGNFAAIAGLKENSTNGNEDGYLAFFTVPNSNGLLTERARITSAGRLLVNGTTDNGYLVQLFGSNGLALSNIANSVTANPMGVLGTYNLDINNGGLTFSTINAGSVGERARIDSSGNLLVGTTSGSGDRIYASGYIRASSGFKTDGTTWIDSPASETMRFVTNNTERARITSGGFFKASDAGTYIGSTGAYHELRSSNDNYLLYAVNTRNSGNGPFGISVEYSAQDPNGTTNEFLQCVGISTLRAEIRSNGGLANYSANDVNLSDRREKTNFAPAKSYLDTICAIPVQTFNYIDQSEDDPGLTLGVVAQDVQAVAPELVMESNWGTEDNPKMRLSIYQTDLQYALMKALQELKSEFDAYKATHP